MNIVYLIFLCGFIETWMYAWYVLKLTQQDAIKSSLIVTVQMAIYLSIIAYVIKSMDTFLLICIYCLGCGCGNFCKVKFNGLRITVKKKRKKIDEKI